MEACSAVAFRTNALCLASSFCAKNGKFQKVSSARQILGTSLGVRNRKRRFLSTTSCCYVDPSSVWHLPDSGKEDADPVLNNDEANYEQRNECRDHAHSRKQGEGRGRRKGLKGRVRTKKKASTDKGEEHTDASSDEDAWNVKSFFSAVRSYLPGGKWWSVAVDSGQEERKDSVTTSLLKLWNLAAPDKTLLCLAFVFLMVSALAEIAIPHFVAATLFAASNGLRATFNANSRTLGTIVLVFGVFSGLRGGSFTIINQRLVKRMRTKLYGTLIRQDVAFFDSEAVGDLTSRLGSDCHQVSRVIGGDVNIMFRNAVQGVGALAYLVRLSWPLALTTATLSFCMWQGIARFGRFQRQAAKVVQDTAAAANEVAEETFSLARVVRAFGTEAQEAARYGKFADKLLAVGLRKSVAYGFWTWGSNTLYSGVQVVALALGGALLLRGSLNAEQLTKYIWYAESVVHSTWWVGEHWASLMEAMGASQRVFDLMDLPQASQLTEPGRTLPQLRGQIEFRSVSFSYPTRPTIQVLKNVDLTVQPGQLVALVGLSGSGKSTMVSLLQRMYEPSKGQILLDGVPLQELDTSWFRQQVGVVSQEPRLFSTDIAANIGYGTGPDLPPDAVVEASRTANAHDFIMAMPEGYASVVDNARLSGGQKQRIAIARALVRDPKILILDEATSALDAESEHSVQLALERAMRDESGARRRTVLVIAHRLSTIRKADYIVVMKGGEIIEMGNHKELVALDGEYAQLNHRQLDTVQQFT